MPMLFGISYMKPCLKENHLQTTNNTGEQFWNDTSISKWQFSSPVSTARQKLHSKWEHKHQGHQTKVKVTDFIGKSWKSQNFKGKTVRQFFKETQKHILPSIIMRMKMHPQREKSNHSIAWIMSLSSQKGLVWQTPNNWNQDHAAEKSQPRLWCTFTHIFQASYSVPRPAWNVSINSLQTIVIKIQYGEFTSTNTRQGIS